MIDILPLLFIALICIVVGFVSGMLISGSRNTKEPEPSREIAPVEDARPLISFQLPRIGAGWRLELDGKTYTTPGELDASQRNQLLQGITELRNWMVVDQKPASAPDRALNSAAAPAPLNSSVPVSTETDKNRVNLNPINVFTRAIQSDVKQVDKPNKSIAAQIDEILQEKLENSSLANRAIRLMELPGKGMVVMVGLDQFDGVNSVPDPEIQELIRSCVAEWERRVA